MTSIAEHWPDDPKLAHWVLLDLETTGGKHDRDFITEIALIEVYQGEVIDTWQTLICPPVTIPPWITRVTGINNAMVADAPRFEEIAQTLLDKLNGKILVAHNARFDYGFLKAAFKRLHLHYQAPTLCTVKLSRALFPQHNRHGLDQIMDRYGLACADRHRAQGDVQVLWEFVKALPHYASVETIWAQIRNQLKQPSLPPNLDPSALMECEDVPGIYRFYNQLGQVIYVGKSVQLRSRILSHFNSDHRIAKDQQISQDTHHVDWIECAGDFSAQLLESQEVKRLSPKHNVRLRKLTKLWSFRKTTDTQGYQHLILSPSEHLESADLGEIYGLFRSQKQALADLEKRVTEHRLCQRLTGLEKKKSGACFAYQLKKCKGACCGQEPPELYNLRQELALQALKNPALERTYFGEGKRR